MKAEVITTLGNTTQNLRDIIFSQRVLIMFLILLLILFGYLLCRRIEMYKQLKKDRDRLFRRNFKNGCQNTLKIKNKRYLE